MLERSVLARSGPDNLKGGRRPSQWRRLPPADRVHQSPVVKVTEAAPRICLTMEKLSVSTKFHWLILTDAGSAGWASTVPFRGMMVLATGNKAEDAVSRVVLVDPRNTTQLCSRCDLLVRKELSDRIHNCPFCGLVMDRDQNAAINILRLGLQSLAAKAAWKPTTLVVGVVTASCLTCSFPLLKGRN